MTEENDQTTEETLSEMLDDALEDLDHPHQYARILVFRELFRIYEEKRDLKIRLDDETDEHVRLLLRKEMDILDERVHKICRLIILW